MRKRVFINNFNYGRFLSDAVDSLLAQTEPADEIVLIDDGSTDGSADDIRRRYPMVTVIEQANAGQLSVFNRIASMVSDQDIVFFMDADDVYFPQHIACVMRYLRADVDFYMIDPHRFTTAKELSAAQVSHTNCDLNALAPVFIPCTSYVTRYSKPWIGVETSGLCLRGRLLKRLLPFPHEVDWRSGADDLLVLGASIIGAPKLWLRGFSFGYRIHGTNDSIRKKAASRVDQHRRNQQLRALVGYYQQVADLPGQPALYEVLRERALLPAAVLARFYVESPVRMLMRQFLPMVY